MGIIKCSKCGTFLGEDEAIWVRVDDNHETAYCVSCSPEDTISSTVCDEDEWQ